MADEQVNKLLAEAPLTQLIQHLGQGVADAQYALDIYALEILAKSAEQTIQLAGDDTPRSIIELGFTPSFYHFSEAKMMAKVAFSNRRESKTTLGASVSGGIKGIFTASVNASYSNKYSFKAEGSSEVTTKVISVPPPGLLSEFIEEIRHKKRQDTANNNPQPES